METSRRNLYPGSSPRPGTFEEAAECAYCYFDIYLIDGTWYHWKTMTAWGNPEWAPRCHRWVDMVAEPEMKQARMI